MATDQAQRGTRLEMDRIANLEFEISRQKKMISTLNARGERTVEAQRRLDSLLDVVRFFNKLRDGRQ